MNIPNCPMCNTNEFMQRIPDCSCHAWGSQNKSIYYSDSFVCAHCGGHIGYHEETIGKEIMWMRIDYRKDGYAPNVKVIG